MPGTVRGVAWLSTSLFTKAFTPLSIAGDELRNGNPQAGVTKPGRPIVMCAGDDCAAPPQSCRFAPAAAAPQVDSSVAAVPASV